VTVFFEAVGSRLLFSADAAEAVVIEPLEEASLFSLCFEAYRIAAAASVASIAPNEETV
jgi:hypothetical protein